MPIYKLEGKKDGLQKYRVRVAWRDDNGKHEIERIAYGRAQAELLEMELKRDIKKEGSSRMKVEDLYKEYLESKEIRDTTKQQIDVSFRLHILPYIGDVYLDKLTTARLQKWKTELGKTKLATTSKNNIYRDLRTMLNYAVRMEYIDRSPLVKVDRFRDPYEEDPVEKLQYYTPEQFLRYIAAAREKCATMTHWGLYTFFAIAYYTGARKGEINALRWTDLDGNKMRIRKSINMKTKNPKEAPPKTKSSNRTIQMPAPLMDILKEQKERQMAFDGFSENWKVCGGFDYLADTTIDKFNRDVAEAAGLPRIRVHDFRHSHASLLANNGINIQEVARRLGHTKVEITWKTYSHLYPQEEERALAVLNTVK